MVLRRVLLRRHLFLRTDLQAHLHPHPKQVPTAEDLERERQQRRDAPVEPLEVV